MGGFPNRPGRDDFGATMEDALLVENPKQDISAFIFNLSFWQLAGLSRVSPRAVIAFTVDAVPAVDGVPFQALAWDPEALLPALVIVRTGVGIYQIPFAATYPDETGTQRATALIGGFATVLGISALEAKINMVNPNTAEVRVFDKITTVVSADADAVYSANEQALINELKTNVNAAGVPADAPSSTIFLALW